MGADLITVGYTYQSGGPARDEAEAILVSHLEAIRLKLDSVDASGLLDGLGYDEQGLDEDGEDMLLATLLTGFEAHWDTGRYGNTYTIPLGSAEQPYKSDYTFVVAGGTSYGDSPFEGFDELCLLINATDEFPELGRQLHILGGGIVLSQVQAVAR